MKRKEFLKKLVIGGLAGLVIATTPAAVAGQGLADKADKAYERLKKIEQGNLDDIPMGTLGGTVEFMGYEMNRADYEKLDDLMGVVTGDIEVTVYELYTVNGFTKERVEIRGDLRKNYSDKFFQETLEVMDEEGDKVITHKEFEEFKHYILKIGHQRFLEKYK